ncbi:MAG: GNAT family N-acetyltransferase [Chloroflexi bacterium]|nr:GNAT family N-acetyltransferase [Chloroflexota bacterium]
MTEAKSIELIRRLEEIAANAWPAEVVQVVDGWRLRFNGGVTRRANSVWPNGNGDDHSLAEKLALVEDFYARRGGPARYQMCPTAQPTNLDEILAGRGYTTDARTAVQIASLETVLTRTEAHPAHTVAIGEAFDEGWFDLYCQAERVSAQAAEGRRGILQRIGPRTGFAFLQIAGQPAAIGLGVVERGWLGLFSLATHPQFRRQGAAITIIYTLAQWGQAYDAEQVYLQVMADNPPALALYTRLGFETLYYYHYRELAR